MNACHRPQRFEMHFFFWKCQPPKENDDKIKWFYIQKNDKTFAFSVLIRHHLGLPFCNQRTYRNCNNNFRVRTIHVKSSKEIHPLGCIPPVYHPRENLSHNDCPNAMDLYQLCIYGNAIQLLPVSTRSNESNTRKSAFDVLEILVPS